MDNAAQGPKTCPWCGERVESFDSPCGFCGRMPDWYAWVESKHAEAESVLPPGWKGLTTFESLRTVADIGGYLRRELAGLRLLGEKGRSEFWLGQANELYANIFRALDNLRIADRPEQLSKAESCDEAELRLSNLWVWFARQSQESASPGNEPVAPINGAGDFIEGLLAGPDDVELSARECALLRAYLKQPISARQMQEDAESDGKSEPAKRRNKLRLILAFNRDLQADKQPPIEQTPVDVPQSTTPVGNAVPRKPKRSTEKGEGRAKLIAALTQHHKYADGSCLHLEPIGNNELARQAKVDPATASAFFKKEFDGHGKYKSACTDVGLLIAAIKLLNGDIAPHFLYGRRPADEDDRDKE